MLGCTCKNLPVIYEAAERKGENLVIEEFVEGDTLDFLLKGAIFSPRETRQIIRQLCQGLWVLHSMAAVHRDIKPENVILRGTDGQLPERCRRPDIRIRRLYRRQALHFPHQQRRLSQSQKVQKIEIIHQ